MDLEFPRMMLRVGSMVELESGRYDWRIVSADEFEKAKADGWHMDQYAAKAAHEKRQVDANDDGEVTREELEQKAKELGLKFDGRTGNKKLLAMIEEALK